PPFAAVQMVHWWRERGQVDARKIMDFGRLASGWEALVALLAGFGAAVPFMDTTLFVGPASSGWLHGGDIAFYVGFVVGGLVYAAIRYAETGSARDVGTAPLAVGRDLGTHAAGAPVPAGVPTEA
ncbi:MAG TPA: hypothetical protein VKR78_02455, partial [Acidimicrobiales bacterium]|nr:hypothetical protein [Acidimicrobiales bacterium]